MCMGKELGKKELNQYVRANRKDGSIVVWKVVIDYTCRYVTDCERVSIMDVLKQRRKDCTPGYAVHAFRDRKSAKVWADDTDIIIRCRVKAKWIRAIGVSDMGIKRTISASLMVMPKYPQRSVSLKRFRKVCKEHGI